MNATNKFRLDQYLVENKYCETRSKARALILAGQVLVNDVPLTKAGDIVKEGDVVRIKEQLKYVSRGGLKLEKALSVFQVDAKDLICLDVGGSTGGFTDCLLQNQAQLVYYVDVGYGQIDWKLRTDKRVILFEKENFRYFETQKLQNSIDLCVIDVSFISLKKILPKVLEVFRTGYDQTLQSDKPKTLICLVKPQFELNPSLIGKGGIVKNKEARNNCVDDLKNFVENMGLTHIEVTESPITGKEGNVEYLLKGVFNL